MSTLFLITGDDAQAYVVKAHDKESARLLFNREFNVVAVTVSPFYAISDIFQFPNGEFILKGREIGPC
jgi:hypothetical protein